MNSYTLGLDIGSNSIGWALINTGKKPSIIDIGVRVFPEGVDRDTKGLEKSKNAKRRESNNPEEQQLIFHSSYLHDSYCQFFKCSYPLALRSFVRPSGILICIFPVSVTAPICVIGVESSHLSNSRRTSSCESVKSNSKSSPSFNAELSGSALFRACSDIGICSAFIMAPTPLCRQMRFRSLLSPSLMSIIEFSVTI